ncbi:PACE efflux transporter [Vibrio methylphosphonaticus]|uniref:PACE efflux transporter n=1 Tax=Vibrio methylphosphonaticus TaxID=2946866 RepID=UPI002029F2EB|nr:PACE efflux transporter [Vibrio methylphosphonaticus]MCL9776913.1 PACE efflux transporter [Vibrio methylphosphonaticus]
MRTPADRLRHTILFELFLLIIAAPICMFIFGASAETATITAVGLSLIAMLWNFIYNYVFDACLYKLNGTTKKSSTQRVFHAILFEFGLLFATIPLLAWSLNLSLIDAIVADIGFVVIALFYSYFFNLMYDNIYPLPDLQLDNK